MVRKRRRKWRVEDGQPYYLSFVPICLFLTVLFLALTHASTHLLSHSLTARGGTHHVDDGQPGEERVVGVVGGLPEGVVDG